LIYIYHYYIFYHAISFITPDFSFIATFILLCHFRLDISLIDIIIIRHYAILFGFLFDLYLLERRSLFIYYFDFH